MSGKCRSIRALHRAQRDDIGDLITRRPLPSPALRHLDPFLFLNHHGPQSYPPHNQGLPFGPHPHRGFSTLTFIFEGELAHQDSAGHESIIGKGGVQWMTAGRGIVHSELSPRRFMEKGGPLEILQLWINLPQRMKMIEPFYCGLDADDIPIVINEKQNIRTHIVCDSSLKEASPLQPPIDLYMSWIEMDASSTHHLSVPAQHSIFLYVVRGHVEIGEKISPAFTLIEFDAGGDVIEMRTDQGALLIFGHSPVQGDPIVYGGPFVMNSDDDIKQAFTDYRNGRLGHI